MLAFVLGLAAMGSMLPHFRLLVVLKRLQGLAGRRIVALVALVLFQLLDGLQRRMLGRAAAFRPMVPVKPVLGFVAVHMAAALLLARHVLGASMPVLLVARDRPVGLVTRVLFSAVIHRNADSTAAGV